MKDYKSFLDECIILTEVNTSGHDFKKVNKWIKSNGFSLDRTGKEPIYRHDVTGKVVTGVNNHKSKSDVSPSAVRNIRKAIIAHHNTHKLNYTEI